MQTLYLVAIGIAGFFILLYLIYLYIWYFWLPPCCPDAAWDYYEKGYSWLSSLAEKKYKQCREKFPNTEGMDPNCVIR